jgi:hypothetical protein
MLPILVRSPQSEVHSLGAKSLVPMNHYPSKINKLTLGATWMFKFHPLSTNRQTLNARQRETTILHHI